MSSPALVLRRWFLSLGQSHVAKKRPRTLVAVWAHADDERPVAPILAWHARPSERSRRSDEVVAEIVQCGKPISSFTPLRKPVERLNVGGRKTSAIEGGVRYERFDQTRLFVRILCCSIQAVRRGSLDGDLTLR